MADTPLAYTVTGAVKASGATRTRLFEEIRAGRIPARKMGRRTIILADDLTRWLTSLPPKAA